MTPDETLAIRVGSVVLGRFEVQERVASGGFAVIWKANDRLLGKDVALKVLQSSIAEDPAAVEEMKHETLRSRELTHPHIVQTYDFIQDGTVVAIAMEFIDGETMSTLASRRPNSCFNPMDLAMWMGDICDALDYAHSEKGGKKSVIHHDIKPSNLIVDRFGTAKVLDFGIAKSIAETRFQRTGQFAVAGTPPYMSPQQIRGQRPSPSDDIYSFGATVFALLTGKAPFFRGELGPQIMSQTPPTMNARRTELGVDEPPIALEWEEVVASCLAKEPVLRPSSMNEIAVRLGLREPSSRRTGSLASPSSQRVRSARAGASGTGGADASTARHTRRGRVGVWIGAVGVTAVVAGGIVVLMQRDRQFASGTSDTPRITPSAVAKAVEPDMVAASNFDLLPTMEAPSPEVTAEIAERERVAREKKKEERRVELREQAESLILEQSWEQAALVLSDLVEIVPDDPEVAKWFVNVQDQMAVRDLVEGYRSAQQALDANAYRIMWVDLDAQQLEALRRAYADIRMLTLTIEGLVVEIRGVNATVRMREQISFELRGVGQQQYTDSTTVLMLRKTVDGWKIVARSTDQ